MINVMRFILVLWALVFAGHAWSQDTEGDIQQKISALNEEHTAIENELNEHTTELERLLVIGYGGPVLRQDMANLASQVGALQARLEETAAQIAELAKGLNINPIKSFTIDARRNAPDGPALSGPVTAGERVVFSVNLDYPNADPDLKTALMWTVKQPDGSISKTTYKVEELNAQNIQGLHTFEMNTQGMMPGAYEVELKHQELGSAEHKYVDKARFELNVPRELKIISVLVDDEKAGDQHKNKLSAGATPYIFVYFEATPSISAVMATIRVNDLTDGSSIYQRTARRVLNHLEDTQFIHIGLSPEKYAFQEGHTYSFSASLEDNLDLPVSVDGGGAKSVNASVTFQYGDPVEEEEDEEATDDSEETDDTGDFDSFLDSIGEAVAKSDDSLDPAGDAVEIPDTQNEEDIIGQSSDGVETMDPANGDAATTEWDNINEVETVTVGEDVAEPSGENTDEQLDEWDTIDEVDEAIGGVDDARINAIRDQMAKQANADASRIDANASNDYARIEAEREEERRRKAQARAEFAAGMQVLAQGLSQIQQQVHASNQAFKNTTSNARYKPNPVDTGRMNALKSCEQGLMTRSNFPILDPYVARSMCQKKIPPSPKASPPSSGNSGIIGRQPNGSTNSGFDINVAMPPSYSGGSSSGYTGGKTGPVMMDSGAFAAALKRCVDAKYAKARASGYPIMDPYGPQMECRMAIANGTSLDDSGGGSVSPAQIDRCNNDINTAWNKKTNRCERLTKKVEKAAKFGTLYESGGVGVHTFFYQGRPPAGASLSVSWDMYKIPDRLIVYYDNRAVLDTGMTSFTGRKNLPPFSGSSVRVVVTGTDNQTRWEFRLGQ